MGTCALERPVSRQLFGQDAYRSIGAIVHEVCQYLLSFSLDKGKPHVSAGRKATGLAAGSKVAGLPKGIIEERA